MLQRSCCSKYNRGEKLQRDYKAFQVNFENIKRQWQYYLWSVKFF